MSDSVDDPEFEAIKQQTAALRQQALEAEKAGQEAEARAEEGRRPLLDMLGRLDSKLVRLGWTVLSSEPVVGAFGYRYDKRAYSFPPLGPVVEIDLALNISGAGVRVNVRPLRGAGQKTLGTFSPPDENAVLQAINDHVSKSLPKRRGT